MLESSQTNKVTNWLPKTFSFNQSKRLNQLWTDSHIFSAHPGYTLSEFTTKRIPKGGRNIPIHNQHNADCMCTMHVHYVLKLYACSLCPFLSHSHTHNYKNFPIWFKRKWRQWKLCPIRKGKTFLDYFSN